MNKIFMFVFVSSLWVGTQVQAYSYNNQNSAAARYYKGEISTDQYLDSLGCPSARQSETTIYNSKGGTTIIREQGNTGTIYHSNGTNSVYYRR